MDHYKKNESRKLERLHFERKLQSNLDQYVTRAVTELVYRMPDDLTDVGEDDEDADDRGKRGEAGGGSQDGTHSRTGAQHQDSVNNAASASEAPGDSITLERFPIPLEVGEKQKLRRCCSPLVGRFVSKEARRDKPRSADGNRLRTP